MSESQVLFIASDHAGFELKQKILEKLSSIYTLQDLGTGNEESCDYPDFADKLCFEVSKRPEIYRGILVCGSGQGMVMRANKFPQIRAALCWNEEVAKLSRQHNKANVICLGSRVVSESQNLKALEAFLGEGFAGGRHERRVNKIHAPIPES